MLAGFEQPSAGRIFVGADDITHVPVEKRGIGMVFQNYALFPNMTVGENIGFPLKVRRMAGAEIASKVKRALAMVRLEGLGDRRPQQLSGGQQQRVAVARALVFEPRLVLLDEPLGALDRQLREQMQYELKHLHERLGVTMVYVTHDQVEAMTMSDRVAVFSAGQLRQVAEPRRLYEEPEVAVRRAVPGREQHPGRHGAATSWRPVQRRARQRTGRGRDRCRCERRVNLAIRPEKVALGAVAAGYINRFPAKVLEVSFLGDQLRVRLAALGREDFIVKFANAPRQAALEPGGTVEIGWRAEDCRALGE